MTHKNNWPFRGRAAPPCSYNCHIKSRTKYKNRNPAYAERGTNGAITEIQKRSMIWAAESMRKHP